MLGGDEGTRWRSGGSNLVVIDVSSASDIPFDGCIVHLSTERHEMDLGAY
jgi:hypothetical protein